MPKITVTIPVGPEPHHKRWLDECIASVREQTHPADEILLIDDMAGLPLMGSGITIWHAPWRLGIAAVFNCGVALAANDLVFMLGADDKLLPSCLEKCLDAFEREKQRDGYYGVGVKYSDGRDDQYVPCHAAMVTKGLWRLTGGFPPESAVGAPDAALLSIILGNDLGLPILVNGNEPLYWYRVHEDSDTAHRAAWQQVILGVRHIVTAQWKQPAGWGRYQP